MQRYGSSGYKEIQHTADLSLIVWSDTISGLFQEAFKGMVSLVGYTSKEDPVWFLDYRKEDGDIIDQLIGFLNEILFLLENGNAVISIEEKCNENNGYLLRLYCCKVSNPGLLIKAVTYSGANLIFEDGIYEVKIVFDV